MNLFTGLSDETNLFCANIEYLLIENQTKLSDERPTDPGIKTLSSYIKKIVSDHIRTKLRAYLENVNLVVYGGRS